MIFKAKIIIIVALIVLTGCGYDDETLEGRNYVDMVCSSAWPDFKQLNPDCTKPEVSAERY